MILTKAKPWSEIEAALDRWNLQRLVVIGCGLCAAQAGTGGTLGVEKILENLKAINKDVLASIVIEEPCDKRTVKKDLRYIKEEVKEADGIIVAACGTGVQTVQEITDKITITTTDTIMISQTERIGKYQQKCKACGVCHLNETGGICPITACAKSLLNGPCGGQIDGKCEVGEYEYDCGWVRIYERLKKLGKLDLFFKYREPRDWSLETEKREVDHRKDRRTYYSCEK